MDFSIGIWSTVLKNPHRSCVDFFFTIVNFKHSDGANTLPGMYPIVDYTQLKTSCIIHPCVCSMPAMLAAVKLSSRSPVKVIHKLALIFHFEKPWRVTYLTIMYSSF